MRQIVATNIVGTSSTTAWSQAQSISYDGGHQLWVVLKLECHEVGSLVDLTVVGAEIIADLEEKGQGAATSQDLRKLVDTTLAETPIGIEVQIIVGSLRDNSLVIYGKGGVAVYLGRDGQLAKLKENFGVGGSIEGQLEKGDVFTLCTIQFTQVVGVASLKHILLKDSDPAEALAPLLHKQDDTSGVAAVVGIVKESSITQSPILGIKLKIDVPKKLNLWVGGSILILLVIMIGVGMGQRVKRVAERAFNDLDTSVRVKVEESLSAAELNPERARILLSEAKSEVEGYLDTDIRDEYREKGNKLLTQIASTEDQAFKKNEIELTTMVELRVLAEGLSANQMKSDGKGNLVFGDTTEPRIVAMNIGDRSRQIVKTASDKMIDLAVSEAKLYGLSATVVNEYFWKKDESKKLIEADEFWKEPESIELFAGNVYILDKDQGEIWKYPTLGDTFGGRRRWFAVGIAPDLTNVVDMKVVGDIWLLTSTGKLERYSRGAPVNFLMEGFPSKGEGKRLVDPRAVWVSESLIYVLESGAERVVVFGDDGKYKAQFVSSEFARASDLVVLDDRGYVLVDNMVKEFGL